MDPKCLALVFRVPNVQWFFSCRATYVSCLNQLLTSLQLQTRGSGRLSRWQKPSNSLRVFSIRCSYAVLDPTELKSCLGEKYMVFGFMVMTQSSSYLNDVLLLSFTKAKQTVTVFYLLSNQA